MKTHKKNTETAGQDTGENTAGDVKFFEEVYRLFCSKLAKASDSGNIKSYRK